MRIKKIWRDILKKGLNFKKIKNIIFFLILHHQLKFILAMEMNLTFLNMILIMDQ